jgi:hypothetical protein
LFAAADLGKGEEICSLAAIPLETTRVDFLNAHQHESSNARTSFLKEIL